MSSFDIIKARYYQGQKLWRRQSIGILLEEIKRLYEQRRWILVSERLPKQGGYFEVRGESLLSIWMCTFSDNDQCFYSTETWNKIRHAHSWRHVLPEEK